MVSEEKFQGSLLKTILLEMDTSEYNFYPRKPKMASFIEPYF